AASLLAATIAVGWPITTSFANDGPERQTNAYVPPTTSFVISEIRLPVSISMPFETLTMIADSSSAGDAAVNNSRTACDGAASNTSEAWSTAIATSFVAFTSSGM